MASMAAFTNEKSSYAFVHALRRNVSGNFYPFSLVRDGNSDQEEWKYISALSWHSRGDKEYRYTIALEECRYPADRAGGLQ